MIAPAERGAIRESLATPPARPPAGLILMLGSMSVFGPLAINMYMPALPAIGRDLGAPTASIQMTVATFMFGLAAGQLFWGAASERAGRRPIVLAGFALFLVATLVCALARSVELLLAARLAQGVGACAGMVLARAIVSDNFEGPEAAVIISWQQLIMGIAPIFAPPLGGLLLAGFGWRAIFWTLLAGGALLVIALWVRLPESRSDETAAHARTETRAAAYARVIANRRILGHLLAGSLSAATLMTWYSGASPLFQDGFGWSAATASGVIAILGVTIVTATQINRALLKRAQPRRIIDRTLAGGIVVLALVLVAILVRLPHAHELAAAGLILGVTSYGFVSANNQALALTLDRRRSGSISALIGAGNYGFGAVFAWIVTLLPAHGGAAMIALMIGELAAAAIALRLLCPAPPPA